MIQEIVIQTNKKKRKESIISNIKERKKERKKNDNPKLKIPF